MKKEKKDKEPVLIIITKARKTVVILIAPKHWSRQKKERLTSPLTIQTRQRDNLAGINDLGILQKRAFNR